MMLLLQTCVTAALTATSALALRAAPLEPLSAGRAAVPSAKPASAGRPEKPTSASRPEDPLEKQLPASGHPMLGKDLHVELEGEGEPEMSVTRSVMSGYHTRDVWTDWSHWQRATAWNLWKDMAPTQRQPIRVLLATYVSDTEQQAARWTKNVNQLANNKAGDLFHFVFFHLDETNAEFVKTEWYSKPYVVWKVMRSMCKAEAWSMLDAHLVQNYDYVWLIDADLTLEFFCWELYRSVLSRLRPLVSQPAIIPSRPGGRSSDLPYLTGKAAFSDGQFVVAREEKRSESMSPIIDAVLWPSFLQRLSGSNLKSVWFLNTWWDLGANLHAACCGGTGVVVVNGSPVRHMDTRTLDSELAKRSSCIRAIGVKDANNREMGYADREAMKRALCSNASQLLDQQDMTSQLYLMARDLRPTFLWAATLKTLVQY